MNASQYIHFTADEFAVDPEFRTWCLLDTEDHRVFWNAFLLRYPDKAEAIEQARQIVLDVDQHFDSQKASPHQIERMYHQTLRLAKRKQPTGRIRQRTRQLQVAAAIAFLVAAVAVFGYRAFNHLPNEPMLVAYRTGYGEQQTINLPDGSTVRLNADSKLTLSQPWDTDTRREVWLEGEAYFSIEKKPATQAKFVVHTQELNVEVLGTQFNVNTKEAATQVVLDEGKVKLFTTDATGSEAEAIMMAPGEMASVSRHTRKITKQSIDTQRYSTWKEGYLTYEEATLSEVLNDVHHTFGYTIMVKDSLLLNETISGALSAEDLNDLLVVLEDIMPKITFKKQQRQLIVNTKQ